MLTDANLPAALPFHGGNRGSNPLGDASKSMRYGTSSRASVSFVQVLANKHPWILPDGGTFGQHTAALRRQVAALRLSAFRFSRWGEERRIHSSRYRAAT